MSKAFSFLIVLIMFIVFIVVGFFGVKTIMLGAAAKNWPTIEGEVSAVSVEKVHHSKTKNRRSYDSYHPAMTYKYVVNNNEYTLKERKDGDRSRSKADSYVSSHPVGTKQIIYYNPSNPSQSMTDPSARESGGYFMVIFSVIMVIILGLVMFSIVTKNTGIR